MLHTSWMLLDECYNRVIKTSWSCCLLHILSWIQLDTKPSIYCIARLIGRAFRAVGIKAVHMADANITSQSILTKFPNTFLGNFLAKLPPNYPLPTPCRTLRCMYVWFSCWRIFSFHLCSKDNNDLIQSEQQRDTFQ